MTDIPKYTESENLIEDPERLEVLGEWAQADGEVVDPPSDTLPEYSAHGDYGGARCPKCDSHDVDGVCRPVNITGDGDKAMLDVRCNECGCRVDGTVLTDERMV